VRESFPGAFDPISHPTDVWSPNSFAVDLKKELTQAGHIIRSEWGHIDTVRLPCAYRIIMIMIIIITTHFGKFYLIVFKSSTEHPQ